MIKLELNQIIQKIMMQVIIIKISKNTYLLDLMLKKI
jgi:hypothetical protein